MSNPTAYCPKCGKYVPATFREMTKSDRPTGKVVSARRFPLLLCEHGGLGDRRDEICGHHATQWKGEFDHRFPRNVQKRLLGILSADERQAFVDMREGKRRPDWTLLGEWRKKI
jgi:hypothetical protein